MSSTNIQQTLATQESTIWTKIKNFFSIHHQFEKCGLRVNEIPKGIIAFKIISYSSFFTTLGLCYKFKPTSRFCSTKFGQNSKLYVRTNYPNFTTKFANNTQKLTKTISENTYIKKIPNALGLKSVRFSKALVENAILCKFTLP